MALSFLIPNRTVLLVSDDALYIYKTSAKQARLVEAIPWDAQDFAENVSRVLTKDCGKRPVLLLNDMVEQHYRKERVIKSGVSSLDRSTMLKRRLSVAFGKYAVRAALPLKEKLPKVQGQPSASLYIFAAIPDTEQLNNSMSAVRKSLVSVSGLCLLPVESADMVKTLAQKCNPKSKSVWSIFIGYHRSGNLRQVVTKNGELALTRMSPFALDGQDQRVWSEEVHKEFKATMSYLSRFGYDPDQGLDVTIIGSLEVKEFLEELVEEDCNLNILNVSQAAEKLGISIGPQQDEVSADILHVAWAARKNSLTLPMKAGRVDEVHRPRQVAMAATVLLLLGAAFQSYQFFEQTATLSEIYDDMDSFNRRKVQLDSQYQAEIKKKEDMGFDIRLVQSSIVIHEDLDKKNINALNLFKGVGGALGKNLRIDRIDIGKGKANPISRFIPGASSDVPAFEARMTMTYPGTTNIDEGNKEVRDLRDRLATVLSDHTIQVTKFLKDYEYTEGLVVETGDLEKENLQQDFVAEIVINGPLIEQGVKR